MRTRFSDITGQVFSRLTVLAFDGVDEKQNSRWKCRCECGETVSVRRQGLTGGKTKSCGCLQREAAAAISKTHGATKTPEYSAWKAMKFRCSNPAADSYKDYGARGISVASAWDDFERFLADMGPRPGPGYSIDRIDNDGDYEPGNCRWTTRDVQARNNRRNTYIDTPKGRMTVTDAAAAFGISPEGFRGRIRRGWSGDKLFSPLRPNQS
jgi:hypothetical protein